MIEELHPSLKGVVSIAVEKASVEGVKANCELVFLALPHKASEWGLPRGYLRQVLRLLTSLPITDWIWRHTKSTTGNMRIGSISKLGVYGLI